MSHDQHDGDCATYLPKAWPKQRPREAIGVEGLEPHDRAQELCQR